jgi:hypothetical protein
MPGQSEDRTAKARAALQRKWLDLAGGDRDRADQLRREYYRGLQRRSVAKRRQRRQQKIAAEVRALEASTGLRIMTEEEFARAALRDQAQRR